MANAEAYIENKFREAVEREGGECWKLVSPGRRGVPDRLVLWPGGRMTFVEVKTAAGKLTPLQELCHARLRELGFDVRVLRE